MEGGEWDDIALLQQPSVSVYRLYTTLLSQNALLSSNDTQIFIKQAGRRLSDYVKEAKKAGQEYAYIKYKGTQGNELALKISTKEETVATVDELTKERFLAVLHIHNFMSKFNHRSALISGLDFSKVDWKHKAMFFALLGSGFQFQGKFIMEYLKLEDKEERDEAVRIWWALCHVMDYLSLKGWLQKEKKRTERLPEFSIVDYLEKREFYKRAVPEVFQRVVDAAENNVGVEGIAIIQKCSTSDIVNVLTKLTIIDYSFVQSLITCMEKAQKSRTSGTESSNAVDELAEKIKILLHQ